MATVFENFRDWHPIFAVAKSALADVQADAAQNRFEDNKQKHRKTTAFVLEKIAQDTGVNNDAIIESIMQDGDEEAVKHFTQDGKDIYGNRVNRIIENQFDDLYEATPEGVKKQMYTALEFFKPKDDITGDFAKASKLHQFIAKVSGKLKEYQFRETSADRRKKVEEELVEELNKHYDKVYLNTPERAAEFGNLAKHLKEWVKKKPIVAVKTLAKMYEDKKEEFEKEIEFDDLKAYITTVFDNDNLRQLYATGIAYHQHDEDARRQRDNSEIKQ